MLKYIVAILLACWLVGLIAFVNIVQFILGWYVMKFIIDLYCAIAIRRWIAPTKY